MFTLFSKNKKINTTQLVDEIEKAVYERVKPLGFRKHGRTLHRFVSEDISQVINFQCGVRGLNGLFCVNIGIRVPECSERMFHSNTEKKKYYHDYECTLRCRLGEVIGKKEKWYDLKKPVSKIIKDILSQLEKKVLPAFDVLSSREQILVHRADYSWFYTFGSYQLDECMIYGHLGNIEKAKQLFEEYYQSAVDKYNDLVKNGRKQYLKKGQRVICGQQDITANRNGYVILYGASHRHIDYLDELAVKLGLRE